jgi:trans-feruloyl-CoA hydratase/vanillin synthase
MADTGVRRTWTSPEGAVFYDLLDGVAWLHFNRPEKRNAMNPTLNVEMIEALQRLEAEDAARVVVLTGAEEAWLAGMDLKEYFREVDAGPPPVEVAARRDSAE